MKKMLFTTTITLVIFLFQGTAFVQTLWNGTGHIPTIYQQTWTKAGLLSDGNAITPKAVFNVAGMPAAAFREVLFLPISQTRAQNPTVFRCR